MDVGFDMQGFESFFLRFVRRMDEALKEEAERYPYEMQAAIAPHFKFNPAPESEFASESDPLSIDKGNISRALIPGKDGNIFRIHKQQGFYEPEYGIDRDVVKHSRIQEVGGKIFSKGKMQWFLLKKAKDTGIDKYRIIAGAVIRRQNEEGRGYINITPRPYFEPGRQVFEQRMWPAKMKRIEDKFLTIWKEAERG